MQAMIDDDAELAALEARRIEIHQARQQRIQDLQFRLHGLRERLQSLSRPVKPGDPNAVPAVKELHAVACAAIRKCEEFPQFHELPSHQVYSGIDANRVPILRPGVLEKHESQTRRLAAEAREKWQEYCAAVMQIGGRLNAEAEAKERQAGIEAAAAKEEIARIEGELLRLER